nr:MAG TPA: hypothetical protein [Caudoviricetes sp.]
MTTPFLDILFVRKVNTYYEDNKTLIYQRFIAKNI